jgi:hypothetical protein
MFRRLPINGYNMKTRTAEIIFTHPKLKGDLTSCHPRLTCAAMLASFHKKWGVLCLPQWPSASEEGLFPMELVNYNSVFKLLYCCPREYINKEKCAYHNICNLNFQKGTNSKYKTFLLKWHFSCTQVCLLQTYNIWLKRETCRGTFSHQCEIKTFLVPSKLIFKTHNISFKIYSPGELKYQCIYWNHCWSGKATNCHYIISHGIFLITRFMLEQVSDNFR